MSSTPLDSVAVVSVSYNSGRHLQKFLTSIRASEPQGVTVVVADNGSSDIESTRTMCAEHSATLLELDDNYGYGGAINRAIATLPATVTTVLISNPDVVFTAGSITALAAAMDDLPGAGAVGPRVLNSDGTVYPSARRLPSLRTGTGHALLGRVWPANPWTTRYLSDLSESSVNREAGWLSGSCLLVRRTAYDAIGGFDDAFFMYFEDVDLGYRLGKAGWKSFYIPDAVVTHSGAHSTGTESSRMLQAHHKSAYLYLSRKYAAWYLAPLRWSLRAGLGFRSWWLTRAAR